MNANRSNSRCNHTSSPKASGVSSGHDKASNSVDQHAPAQTAPDIYDGWLIWTPNGIRDMTPEEVKRRLHQQD